MVEEIRAIGLRVRGRGSIAWRSARAALGSRKPEHLDLGGCGSAGGVNIGLANRRPFGPMGCHCLPGTIREDTSQPRGEPHGTCRVVSAVRRVVRGDEMATGRRSGDVLVQSLAGHSGPDHRIQHEVRNQARSKQQLDFDNTLTPGWGT